MKKSVLLIVIFFLLSVAFATANRIPSLPELDQVTAKNLIQKELNKGVYLGPKTFQQAGGYSCLKRLGFYDPAWSRMTPAAAPYISKISFLAVDVWLTKPYKLTVNQVGRIAISSEVTRTAKYLVLYETPSFPANVQACLAIPPAMYTVVFQQYLDGWGVTSLGIPPQ